MLHRRRRDLHSLSEKERKPRLARAWAPEDKRKQTFLNKISFEKPDTQLRLKLNPFFSYARLAFRHAKEEVSGWILWTSAGTAENGIIPPSPGGAAVGTAFPSALSLWLDVEDCRSGFLALLFNNHPLGFLQWFGFFIVFSFSVKAGSSMC